MAHAGTHHLEIASGCLGRDAKSHDRGDVQLMVDARVGSQGREREAVAARKLLDMRHKPHVSIHLVLIEPLNGPAKPGDVELEPRSVSGAASIQAESRLGRWI